MKDTYLGGSVTGNTHNVASMFLSLGSDWEKGVNPFSQSGRAASAQPYFHFFNSITIKKNQYPIVKL